MDRRACLKSIALFSCAAAFPASVFPAPEPNAANVTVTGAEIFRVRVSDRGNWVLVRLSTNAGVQGIGDASHAGANDPQIERLRDFFSRIEGRSVYDVEWLRQSVKPDIARDGRAAACAFSGIEQALYDIQARVAGVPLYQLFGGKLRNQVRQYANINRFVSPRTPDGFAARATRAIEDGFDAIKMAPFDGMPSEPDAKIEAFTEQGVQSARSVRGVIGADRDLLIDAHFQFDLGRGLDLVKRLAPLQLFWLEEVTRSPEEQAVINDAAPMPTAGGESLNGLEENVRYLRSGAADILMPDLKYCAGMLELKKIAALAEGFGVAVAPHGVASPVGNLAAAHVCAGLSNFLILELAHGEVPWRAEIIDPPEQHENGYLSLSDRPGLGIQLNDRVVADHLVS